MFEFDDKMRALFETSPTCVFRPHAQWRPEHRKRAVTKGGGSVRGEKQLDGNFNKIGLINFLEWIIYMLCAQQQSHIYTHGRDQ